MDIPHQTQVPAAAIEWLPVDARAPRLWTISGVLATAWIGVPVSLLASTALPWSGAIALGLGCAGGAGGSALCAAALSNHPLRACRRRLPAANRRLVAQ